MEKVSAEEVSARKRWELENHIQVKELDSKLSCSTGEDEKLRSEQPWRKDPNYFQKVEVSAVALLKMIMHARSGCKEVSGEEKNREVMGLVMGHVRPHTFIVTDVFPLDVEGSETRVNPGAESESYMVEVTDHRHEVGKAENVCGWYHSHPSYRPFLSGVDVGTQLSNQAMDPYVALVIDPIYTALMGKVDLGAFRAYADRTFYRLEISYFKTALDVRTLDLLWHRYWHQTLSQDTFRSRELEHAESIGSALDKSQSSDLCAVVAEQLKEFMVFQAKNKVSCAPGGEGGKKKKEEKTMSDITPVFEKLAK